MPWNEWNDAPETPPAPKRNGLRLAAAVLLIAATAALVSIHSPWAERVSRQLRAAVSLDIDETLGQVHFIRDRRTGAVEASVTAGPKVVQDFRATGGNGVVVRYPAGAAVKSPVRARVLFSGSGAVELLTLDGAAVRLTGCGETPLHPGTDVSAGDIVAVAGQGEIRVTVSRFGVQVDPATLSGLF